MTTKSATTRRRNTAHCKTLAACAAASINATLVSDALCGDGFESRDALPRLAQDTVTALDATLSAIHNGRSIPGVAPVSTDDIDVLLEARTVFASAANSDVDTIFAAGNDLIDHGDIISGFAHVYGVTVDQQDLPYSGTRELIAHNID